MKPLIPLRLISFEIPATKAAFPCAQISLAGILQIAVSVFFKCERRLAQPPEHSRRDAGVHEPDGGDDFRSTRTNDLQPIALRRCHAR